MPTRKGETVERCPESDGARQAHVIVCVYRMMRLAIIARDRIGWPFQDLANSDGSVPKHCAHHTQVLLYFMSTEWFHPERPVAFIDRVVADLIRRIEDGRFPV